MVTCIVAAAVVGALSSIPPVGALPAQGEPVTWGIQPAGPSGTRSAFEYAAVPGSVVDDVVRIENFGTTPLTLEVYAADAFNAPRTGAFDVTVAGRATTGVGSWTHIAEPVVTIPPRGHVDIPFTVVVPANAEPGDHAGGIVAARTSRADGSDPLQVEHRVGSRIYVHVDGPRHPSLVVDEMTASYEGTLNPFGRGEISVSYVVRNEGNIRLAATQWMEVEGLAGIGSTRIELEDMPELLPGSTFAGSAVITDVLPGFRVTSNLHLETRSPAGPEGEVVAGTDTWAVPWTFIGLVVIVGAIVAGAVAWFVGNRRRLAALTAAAAAAGAATGSGAGAAAAQGPPGSAPSPPAPGG